MPSAPTLADGTANAGEAELAEKKDDRYLSVQDEDFGQEMRKIVELRVAKYLQPSHPLYFRMDRTEREKLTEKLTGKIVETERRRHTGAEEGASAGKRAPKMDREKVVLKVKKYVQSWFQKKKEERKRKRQR